jgi:transcription elongation factor Elf1
MEPIESGEKHIELVENDEGQFECSECGSQLFTLRMEVHHDGGIIREQDGRILFRAIAGMEQKLLTVVCSGCETEFNCDENSIEDVTET